MPSLLKQTPKSYRTITPTSCPWLQMKYDIKNYKEHWQNVIHAKAKVDHAAPKLLASFYTRTNQTSIDAKRLQTVDRENKELLQKINISNRTIGKVDSWMPKYVLRSNFDHRKREARQIAKTNLVAIEKILKTGSVIMPTKKMMEDWKRIEKTMTHIALHPLYWKKKKVEITEDNTTDPPKQRRWTIRNSSIITVGSMNKKLKKLRPRVYLDIATTDGEKLGQITIELYNDVVPETAENFRSLCRGDNEEGLTYRGNPFCRIIPGLYCQAGDITQIHGSGGKSIYGDTFQDENFHLKHAGPGVVTMHNTGENTNNSQFMITFKALPTLNGINVVVGKITKGFNTLFRLEELGTPTGKLLQGVVISNCGEVITPQSQYSTKTLSARLVSTPPPVEPTPTEEGLLNYV